MEIRGRWWGKGEGGKGGRRLEGKGGGTVSLIWSRCQFM